MKKLFKKALACLTSIAVSSASIALTPFATTTNTNDHILYSFNSDESASDLTHNAETEQADFTVQDISYSAPTTFTNNTVQVTSYFDAIIVGSIYTDTYIDISYADLGLPTDTIAILGISFDCEHAYSLGTNRSGTGSVGFQSNDKDDGYIEIDMVNIPNDIWLTPWYESLDFDAEGQDISSYYDEGFVRFGWYSSNSAIKISNITIIYTAATSNATTTTVTTGEYEEITTTTTANVVEDTPKNIGIEQLKVSLDDLAANDYEVTVDVYFNKAKNGVTSFNATFLYFAPIESPEDGTLLDPESITENGGQLTLAGSVSSSVRSDNFGIIKDGWSDANGLLQVAGYTGSIIYNDDQTTEPDKVTLYSITFKVPETAVAGDQFNIVWWDEKNSEDSCGVVYDEYYEEYDNVVFTNGYIKITYGEEIVECTGISCETDYIGSFYADDKTTISADGTTITAEMSDGSFLNITADCTVADNATPYLIYWSVYTEGDAAFEFTADIIYNGTNQAVLDYLEATGTDAVCSATLNIAQRGDANLDHSVDTRDAASIAKYCSLVANLGESESYPVLSETYDELAKSVSDVNGDGVIDTRDAASDAKFASIKANFTGEASEAEIYYNIWNEIMG